MATPQLARLRTTRRPNTDYGVSLSKRRTWHVDGDDAGADKGGGANSDDKGKVADKQAEKQLPQSEVDKLVGGARKEGRDKAEADLLKKLGVDKLEDAEVILKAHREKVEADKTEAQKLADAKAAAEKERDDAKAQLEAERKQRVLDKRDGAIKAKAGKAFDADAVLEWAGRAANEKLLAATVKDDGSVDDEAVDALITACQKAAPHLWKKGGVGSPSNSDGRVPEDTGKDKRPVRPFGSL